MGNEMGNNNTSAIKGTYFVIEMMIFFFVLTLIFSGGTSNLKYFD